jgi:hypothetical protein
MNGPNTTLADAQQYVLDNRDEGVRCPCCDQFAKVYRRKLNTGMARSLLWLVGKSLRNTKDGTEPDGWVHLGKEAPQWVQRSRELAKLVHWNLVEQAVNEDTTKRTSGIWRPRPLGRSFVFGMTTLPKRVYLYNNSVLGFDEETTTIQDALGAKFDYAELMEAHVR